MEIVKFLRDFYRFSSVILASGLVCLAISQSSPIGAPRLQPQLDEGAEFGGDPKLSPDGKLLAVAKFYGGVVVWDLATATEIDYIPHVESIEFIGPQRLLAVTKYDSDQQLETIDLLTNQVHSLLRGQNMFQSRLLSNGEIFSLGSIWHLVGDTLVKSADLEPTQEVSPDGQRLVGYDEKSWTDRVKAAQSQRPPNDARDFDLPLSFTVTDRKTGTSKSLQEAPIPASTGGSMELPSRFLVWSPDGSTIARLGSKFLFCWNAETGSLDCKYPLDGYFSLQFSADGKQIYLLDDSNGALTAVDASTGGKVWSVAPFSKAEGSKNYERTSLYSSNGVLILAKSTGTGLSAMVRLDPKTGATLESRGSTVNGLFAIPDGPYYTTSTFGMDEWQLGGLAHAPSRRFVSEALVTLRPSFWEDSLRIGWIGSTSAKIPTARFQSFDLKTGIFGQGISQSAHPERIPFTLRSSSPFEVLSDGKALATATNPLTGKTLASIGIKSGDDRALISPSLDLAAVISDDGFRISLTHLKTKTVLEQRSPYWSRVKFCALSPKGDRAVTISAGAFVNGSGFAPDRVDLVPLAAQSPSIPILSKMRWISPDPDGKGVSPRVVFFKDGSKFLVVSEGGVVLGDSATGAVLARAPACEALCLAPDEKSLYAITKGGVEQWEVPSLKTRRLIHPNNSGFTACGINGSNLTLASATEVRSVDLRTGSDAHVWQISQMVGPTKVSMFAEPAVSANGRYISITISSVDPILFTEAIRGESVSGVFDTTTQRFARLERIHGVGQEFAFRPDGSSLSALSVDGEVTTWDSQTGRLLLDFNAPLPPVQDYEKYAYKDRSGNPRRVEKLTEYRNLNLPFGLDGLQVTDTGFVVSQGVGPAQIFDAHGRILRAAVTPQDDACLEIKFLPGGQVAENFEDGIVTISDSAGKAVAKYSEGVLLNDKVLIKRSANWEKSLGTTSMNYDVVDLTGKRAPRTVALSGQPICLSRDAKFVICNNQAYFPGGAEDIFRIYDLEQGVELATTHELSKPDFSFDDRFLLSQDEDGPAIIIWDWRKSLELCRIYSFKDGTWAITDSEGRYDASNGGDISGLHWVLGTTPIDLSQFKDQFYDPGLLAKKLGLSKEIPRAVPSIVTVKLHPKVSLDVSADGKSASVLLTSQGGGIGKYQVYLNGCILQEGIAPLGQDSYRFDVNLNTPEAQRRLLPISGKELSQNKIQVTAENEAGDLRSRASVKTVSAPQTQAPPVHLYALVAGISKYSDPKLNLGFAEKDANDLSAALKITAGELLGPDRVTVTTLTNAAGVAPTKQNIENAFHEIAKQATSSDIVFVFFAGHGIGKQGNQDDYFYLTQDASLASIADEADRARTTLSGTELGQLLADIPARKQALVLDTCASGQVFHDVTTHRDVPSNVMRAWERLKDRNGVFVLAGCAADAVSYEASNVGQGLLTYSLLEPLSKVDPQILQQVDSGYDVDVYRWFASTEKRVKDLIDNLGIAGIQQPQLRARSDAQSFPVGQLKGSDRGLVPIAQPKPVILLGRFEDPENRLDPLDLTGRLDKALTGSGGRGTVNPFSYWPSVQEQPNARKLLGNYKVEGNVVTVDVLIHEFKRGVGVAESQVGKLVITGSKLDLPGLTSKIVAAVEKTLLGH